MALLELWESNRDVILSYNIDQIVKSSGDGNLRDGSLCSQELRKFLGLVPSKKLFDYAFSCLETSFPNSGEVLQEVVNQLGVRLEYKATHGLYRGKSNAIGFDGIWNAPDGWALVVEVKTTDAYRINLDTIATYRERLIQENSITENSSILIIVGRKDTGDIEAQIRGSRHAWDIRIISVDSLLRLVNLKESSEEEDTAEKIRNILKPFEYTRLDNIIDLVFSAAKDVESRFDEEPSEVEISNSVPTKKQQHTPFKEMAAIRQKIVGAVSEKGGKDLIAKTRSLFWDPEHSFRLAVSVSKPYERSGKKYYWYGFRPSWKEFLREGEKGFYALGLVDEEFAFVIPRKYIFSKLENLNTTMNGDEVAHWHIHIDATIKGDYSLVAHKTGEKISLEDFKTKV